MTNAPRPQAPPARVPAAAPSGSTQHARGGRSLLVRGLLAAGIASVANLVIFVAATAAGASMLVAQDGSEIAVGPMPVLVATFAPLALATVVAWLLAKRWPRTVRILAWVGLVVAAASIIAPLTGALDPGTGIALALMHLVAGASWFAALLAYERR